MCMQIYVKVYKYVFDQYKCIFIFFPIFEGFILVLYASWLVDILLPDLYQLPHWLIAN